MTDDQLRAIYREIMSSALALEKTMTIAYLGPEATFTHQAAIQKFGSSLRYASQKTIADVFTEVSKNRADYGVVPVENTTEGVVTHTLDMFVDSDLKIVSQIVLPIQYCLAGNWQTRENIRRLYVHPQALAQCRVWVQKHLPHAEIIETSSNARSAELVAIRQAKHGRKRPPSPASWPPKNTACTCWSRTFRTTPPTPRASSCWAANAVRPPATTARA